MFGSKGERKSRVRCRKQFHIYFWKNPLSLSEPKRLWKDISQVRNILLRLPVFYFSVGMYVCMGCGAPFGSLFPATVYHFLKVGRRKIWRRKLQPDRNKKNAEWKWKFLRCMFNIKLFSVSYFFVGNMNVAMVASRREREREREKHETKRRSRSCNSYLISR